MYYRKTKSLIFFTAFVYLLFSCSYVLLCSRHTGVINIFQAYHLVAKKAANNTSARSFKFLSRPRVINNRLLTQMAVAVFLLTVIFRLQRGQDQTLLNHHLAACFSSVPIIIRLHSWRI
jgi:hypothetical protein